MDLVDQLWIVRVFKNTLGDLNLGSPYGGWGLNPITIVRVVRRYGPGAKDRV